MQLHCRSIHHDTSAPSGVVSSFLGVQPSCNAINSREHPALHASDRKKQAISSVGTQRKQGGSPGRICEVGPPASRCSYFTFPYSRLRRSTGILLCEASGYRRSVKTPGDQAGKEAPRGCRTRR